MDLSVYWYGGTTRSRAAAGHRQQRGRRRRWRHGGSHLRPGARRARGRGDRRRAGVLRRGSERKDLGLHHAGLRARAARTSFRTTARAGARPLWEFASSGPRAHPSDDRGAGHRLRLPGSGLALRGAHGTGVSEGHRARAPEPRRARLSLDPLRPRGPSRRSSARAPTTAAFATGARSASTPMRTAGRSATPSSARAFGSTRGPP